MPNRAFAYAAHLRPAFLAHMADRLNTLICTQTQDMLSDAGAKTPVRSVSAMIFLINHGPTSIAEIARADGQSHQLVSSRIAPLVELGLVTSKPDPHDDRRKTVALTAKGVDEGHLIQQVCETVAASIDDLNKELGCDLTTAIEQAETSLVRNPIYARTTARSVSRATPAQVRKTKRRG